MIASDGTLVRIRELTTVTELADGSLVLRGLFLRNDNSPSAGTIPASATSFGSWLTHELSQPLGVVLANVDAMRHMLRASPPRVDEALEALADVAQSARDAASLLAVKSVAASGARMLRVTSEQERAVVARHAQCAGASSPDQGPMSADASLIDVHPHGRSRVSLATPRGSTRRGRV